MWNVLLRVITRRLWPPKGPLKSQSTHVHLKKRMKRRTGKYLTSFTYSCCDQLNASCCIVIGRRLEDWPKMVAQLAGWRRVTQQLWFCTRTWWTGRTACLFRNVPVARTVAAQLRADGISSCLYIVIVHNHPSWATSRKEGMTWYSSRPMPSRWLNLLKVP
jgi:hypothetical protein